MVNSRCCCCCNSLFQRVNFSIFRNDYRIGLQVVFFFIICGHIQTRLTEMYEIEAVARVANCTKCSECATKRATKWYETLSIDLVAGPNCNCGIYAIRFGSSESSESIYLRCFTRLSLSLYLVFWVLRWFVVVAVGVSRSSHFIRFVRFVVKSAVK